MKYLFVIFIFVLTTSSVTSQEYKWEYAFKKAQHFSITSFIQLSADEATSETISVTVDSVDAGGNAYLHVEPAKDGQKGFAQTPHTTGGGTEAVPKQIHVSRAAVVDDGVCQIVLSKYGRFLRGSILRESNTRKMQKENLKGDAARYITSPEKEMQMIVENFICRLPQSGVMAKGKRLTDTVNESNTQSSLGSASSTQSGVNEQTTTSYALVDTMSRNGVQCLKINVNVTKTMEVRQGTSVRKMEYIHDAQWIVRKKDGFVLHSDANNMMKQGDAVNAMAEDTLDTIIDDK